MEEKRNFRLPEVDGIRGWAAFSVVCFHFLWETFGVVIPHARNSITQVILEGRMDVALFFALSGEALSARYWASGATRDVVTLAIKRYSRLTIPILFSCLMVYVLLKCHLVFSHEAAPLLKREDWLGLFLSGKNYGFFSILRYSFIDVYFNHQSDTSPNPFLWTMSIELLGSVVVFLFLLCEKHIRRKYVVMTAIGFVFLLAGNFVACFMAGCMLSRLRVSGWFERVSSPTVRTAALFGILASMLVVAYRKDLNLGDEIPTIIGASFCLFCVYSSRLAMWFFGLKISQLLGKISFPLYLVQFPVLISFTSGLTVWAHANDRFHAWFLLLVAFVSIFLCVILAFFFRPIETLTRKVGHLQSRLFLADAPQDGKD